MTLEGALAAIAEFPMNESCPHITVGMPVYNGERHVRQAIDSVLSQTFTDLELIISDNGSIDATAQICRDYAARDARVRYYRSDRNRGAAWNFNRVVELARGEFFRWQCHDDYCAPTLIEKCLAVVHEDPGVILCYPQFVRVDDQDQQLIVKSSRIQGEEQAYARFRSMIYRRDSCEEIYGVTRTAVLRKTALIGSYSNSDDTFLAELILYGKFREVREPLFFYRVHSAQSTGMHQCRSDRMLWFDTSARVLFSFPFLRLFGGYLRLLWRSPLRWREKVRCYGAMAGWFWYFRGWLAEDIRGSRTYVTSNWCVPFFRRYAPWSRPVWHWMKRMRNRSWRAESESAKQRRLQREQLERWI